MWMYDQEPAKRITLVRTFLWEDYSALDRQLDRWIEFTDAGHDIVDMLNVKELEIAQGYAKHDIHC